MVEKQLGITHCTTCGYMLAPKDVKAGHKVCKACRQKQTMQSPQ